MSKHTPGPWAYENYRGTVHVFIDNEGGTPSICKLVGNDKDANARLIAAAPDLLEALEYYVEKVADLSRYGVMIETSLREKAEAAIAKAKGEGHE